MRNYRKHTPGDVINGIRFIGYADIRNNRRRGTFECPYCQKHFVTHIWYIKCGDAKSCGCAKSQLLKQKIIHGHCRTEGKSSEYGIYLGMIDRCHNSNNKKYKFYGAKGRVVCDRWRESFMNFYNDMGKRPGKEYSLDRYPDKNGNYEPENCRWATKEEQVNNTIRNIYLTKDGQTKTVSQWAKYLNVSEDMLRGRLKHGVPTDEILNIEKRESNRFFVEYNGKKTKLKELCHQLGKDYQVVYSRIRYYGYTVEDAISTSTVRKRNEFGYFIKNVPETQVNWIRHSFGIINI